MDQIIRAVLWSNFHVENIFSYVLILERIRINALVPYAGVRSMHTLQFFNRTSKCAFSARPYTVVVH